MADCILCKVIAHEAPGSFVYEDERVVAFMDLYPVNRGHVLVVPRDHVEALPDLPEEDWLHVSGVAKRIAGAIRASEVRSEGVNMLLADGQAAFQEVPHVHVHVFPRFRGDSFRIDAKWAKGSRGELDEVAGELRRHLRHNE
jgi:diadenosine tetraphosphate (Ap4A) HIT family hydrolase